MRIRFLPLALSLMFASFGSFSPVVSAQSATSTSMNTSHVYTPHEKLILKNVSQFHQNFDNREWDRNGE